MGQDDQRQHGPLIGDQLSAWSSQPFGEVFAVIGYRRASRGNLHRRALGGDEFTVLLDQY